MNISRAILGSAILFLSLSAHSQSLEDRPLSVNIPFDFTVRHTSLPAGHYTVRQAGAIVMLTSDAGRTANVIVNKEYATRAAGHSSLVFSMYGEAYTLAQIKTAGSSTELDAVVNRRAPRQLEASNDSQVVEVAAVGTR
jgi:hypothetical protein